MCADAGGLRQRRICIVSSLAVKGSPNGLTSLNQPRPTAHGPAALRPCTHRQPVLKAHRAREHERAVLAQRQASRSAARGKGLGVLCAWTAHITNTSSCGSLKAWGLKCCLGVAVGGCAAGHGVQRSNGSAWLWSRRRGRNEEDHSPDDSAAASPWGTPRVSRTSARRRSAAARPATNSAGCAISVSSSASRGPAGCGGDVTSPSTVEG